MQKLGNHIKPDPEDVSDTESVPPQNDSDVSDDAVDADFEVVDEEPKKETTESEG